MNNQEARLILSAYRPRGQDTANPRFQEALEQAKRDPELAAWFALECRIDTALGDKVRERSQPPPHLKAAILAAAAVTRPAPWFHRPVWITAAAAVLVGALVFLALSLPKSGDAAFAALQHDMAELLGSKQFRLDYKTPSASEAQRWLADQRVDFAMPARLESQPAIGCRVIDWQGHKVSLICFKLDGGETVHLFTLDRSALRDAPPAEPQFAVAGRYAVAGWTGGDKVYLMACSRGEAALRKVL
jgi:hypothetical protein